MPKKTTKTSKTNGRDSRGRFASGNSVSLGHGRPRKEQEQAYLLAFQKGLSESDLTAVVKAIVKQAKSGSVAAARLLIDHSVGRPTVRVELDTDVPEYRVAGQTPGEHMRLEMAYLQKVVTEQREYESRLRAAGIQMGRNVSNKKSTGSRSRKKT